MSSAENGLRLLLKDSDTVRATVQVLLLSTEKQVAQNTSASRRAFAVISHRDSLDQHEEGSLFVLEEKSSAEAVDIQHLIPICGDFAISVSQMRLGPASSITDSRDRAGLAITVNPGQLDEPLSFYTHDAKDLQAVLAECRRLNDLSESFLPPQTYAWLADYTSEHTLPLITSAPPDIRNLQRPLHERLSPASAGVPGDDPGDLFLLRDDWVRTRAREQTRKDRSRLTIRIGVFNVNGQPPTQDLASWVRGNIDAQATGRLPPLPEMSPFSIGLGAEKDPLETSSTLSTSDTLVVDPPTEPTNDLPDVLVFGFQELDLSTEALIYSTRTLKEDAWCTAIFAALGEYHGAYRKLASKQLVGILLIIIVRESIAHRFGDLKTCASGVGIMGVMGNKGGTAVQLTYKPADGDDVDPTGGTVLTFVNSHLAAFDEMVARRNFDFADLSKRLVFGVGESATDIWETDVLFWMGDLNYRIDQPDADIRELLVESTIHDWAKTTNVDALGQHDQLRNAIRSGKAFQNFSEFPITHLPSYRYTPGLLTDSLEYDIKRKPAWTDRILYMTSPAVRLHQHTYTSHPNITLSDHRPVSADFTLEVDVYEEDIRLAAMRNLHRQLQGLQREGKKLFVHPEEMEVGDVRYKESVQRMLKLRNDNETPCTYRFVATYEGGDIHPPWLSISPIAGVVLPHQVLDISFTICVDEKTPHQSRELDCNLVMHTGPGLGKDRFIVVQGSYQPSCVGTPLAQLVQLSGPIRTAQTLDPTQSLNSPREIMRLVNWMIDRRLVDAFNVKKADCGSISERLEAAVARVRECLDTGSDFPQDLVAQAYGYALLELLLGLVPPDVKLDSVRSREEAFEALDLFPMVNVNVWISVTAFLHYVVQESPERVNEIAAVLAPVVLSRVATSIMQKRRFVRYFIQ